MRQVGFSGVQRQDLQKNQPDINIEKKLKDMHRKSNTAFTTASYIAGASALLGLTLGGVMVKGGADIERYCVNTTDKHSADRPALVQTQQVENINQAENKISSIHDLPVVNVLNKSSGVENLQAKKDMHNISERLINNGYRVISLSKIGLIASDAGLAMEIKEPKYAAGAIVQGIAYAALLGKGGGLLARSARAAESMGNLLKDNAYAHYDFNKSGKNSPAISQESIAHDVSNIGKLVLNGQQKKAKAEIDNFYKKYVSITKEQLADVTKISVKNDDPRADIIRARKRAAMGTINGMLAASLATSIVSSVADSAVGASIVQSGKTPVLLIVQEYSQKAADLCNALSQGLWGLNLYAYSKDTAASKPEKGMLVTAIGLGMASSAGTGGDSSNGLLSLQVGVQSPYFLNKNKKGRKTVEKFFQNLYGGNSKNNSLKPLEVVSRSNMPSVRAARQHFYNIKPFRAPDISNEEMKEPCSKNVKIRALPDTNVTEGLRSVLNRFRDVPIKNKGIDSSLGSFISNNNRAESNKVLSKIKKNYMSSLKNFDTRGVTVPDPFEVFDSNKYHYQKAGFKAEKQGTDFEKFILNNLNKPLGLNNAKTIANIAIPDKNKASSLLQKDEIAAKLTKDPLYKFDVMKKANEELKQNVVLNTIKQNSG